MNKNTEPLIAISASVSVYGEMVTLADKLADMGVKNILPKGSRELAEGRESVENTEIDWVNDPKAHEIKAKLIKGHFDAIARSSAILVANFAKNKKQNYIGGNVLMEMTVAFYLNKPIYIWGDIPQYSPLIDEIRGMKPIIVNSNFDKLKIEYSKLEGSQVELGYI